MVLFGRILWISNLLCSNRFFYTLLSFDLCFYKYIQITEYYVYFTDIKRETIQELNFIARYSTVGRDLGSGICKAMLETLIRFITPLNKYYLNNRTAFNPVYKKIKKKNDSLCNVTTG